MHWLPTSHGFSLQVLIDVATTCTAEEDSSAGVSMVVLVMLIEAVDVADSDAPFGASLERNVASLIDKWIRPNALTAPPCPLLARKS